MNLLETVCLFVSLSLLHCGALAVTGEPGAQSTSPGTIVKTHPLSVAARQLPSREQVALKTLEIAGGYIGVSRDSEPAQVAEFLDLFELPFFDPESGDPVAFCAAGVSFCEARAWCELTCGDAGDAHYMAAFERRSARYAELPCPLIIGVTQ